MSYLPYTPRQGGDSTGLDSVNVRCGFYREPLLLPARTHSDTGPAPVSLGNTSIQRIGVALVELGDDIPSEDQKAFCRSIERSLADLAESGDTTLALFHPEGDVDGAYQHAVTDEIVRRLCSDRSTIQVAGRAHPVNWTAADISRQRHTDDEYHTALARHVRAPAEYNVYLGIFSTQVSKSTASWKISFGDSANRLPENERHAIRDTIQSYVSHLSKSDNQLTQVAQGAASQYRKSLTRNTVSFLNEDEILGTVNGQSVSLTFRPLKVADIRAVERTLSANAGHLPTSHGDLVGGPGGGSST